MNKKTNIIFALLMFFCAVLFSQDIDRIDSLNSLLNISQSDSNKVNVLLKLGQEYETTRPDISLEYYYKALDIVSNVHNINSKANVFLNIAIAYDYSENQKRALVYYKKSLYLYSELKDTLSVAYISKNIAGIYTNLLILDSALFYIHSSLNTYQKTNNKEGEIDCYLVIGAIAHELHNHKEAIINYNKALIYAEANEDEFLKFFIYNNLGVVFKDISKYEMSEKYFIKSEKITLELDHEILLSTVYFNLGDLYYQKKDYVKSLDFFNKSLKISSQYDDFTSYIEINIGLIKTYIALEKYQEAFSISKDVLKIIEQNKSFVSINILSEFYEQYSFLNFYFGKYEDAYEYLLQKEILDDSLFSIERNKITAELHYRYQNEKKQSEIKSLQDKNSLNKAIITKTILDKNRQRLIIILLIILLFVIILLSAILLTNFRKNKKLNTELILKDNEVHKAQSKMFRIVDVLPQIFFETDVRGNLVSTNENFFSVSGYSKFDFENGLLYSDFVVEQDEKNVKEIIKKLYQTKNTQTFEFLFKKKDNTTFPALMSLTIKQIVGKTEFYGSILDITDRKQREEDIQLLKTSVEQTEDAILIVNKDSIVEYVNPAFTEITGYKISDILGSSPAIVKSGKTPIKVYEELWSTISSGNTWKGKLLNRRKSGELYWEKNTIAPVKNNFGEITHYIATKEDITKEVEKNEKIIKLYTATENNPTSVIILDEKAKITYINPSFTKITGYKFDEVVGKTPSFLDSGKHEKEFYDDLWHCIKVGELWQGVLINKRKNGELYWDASIVIPLRNDEKELIGYVCNDRDITQEIKMNDELQLTLDELNYKNKEITASISYAERIQKAMIPTKTEFHEFFIESLLFFSPKDIVSGDFYWTKSINNKKCLAMGDCTGHSVPGAFLSIIGITILDTAILERKLEKPSDILNFLSKKVRAIFSKADSSGHIKDDMEISFITVDFSEKVFQFASSRNRMYLVRNNDNILSESQLVPEILIKNNSKTLYRISGNREYIGKIDMKADFTNYENSFYEEDIVYLTSDGYYDQFGGKDHKKYKRKLFEEMFFNISDLDMSEQEKYIIDFFNTWKQDLPQTDDVSVIGFKIIE
ncbi:MAG: PAS domain S-box protein [Bacteroidales bacterium]|nr:PAS domain S-box protein [Bacteroidales bacterium]